MRDPEMLAAAVLDIEAMLSVYLEPDSATRMGR